MGIVVRIYKTIDGAIHQIQEPEEGCWIALTNPTATEIFEFSEKFDIEVDDLRSPLDEEERSRIEVEDNYTLILVDVPMIEERNDKDWYGTIPLGIIVTGSMIFTICLEDTPVLTSFMEGRVRSFFTYMKTRFIFQILYRNASMYLRYLRIIDKKSEQVEEKLHLSTRNEELIELLELQKSLTYFITSLRSNEVKNLEKKLGHTLFVRSTKRVILTPEGELLLQHVKPALSMLNEGEAVLSGEGNLTGQLRIGASDTLCRYFLIPYLRRFHKDHPEVRIKIINSTSIGCAELLENGQAELIVTNYPNSRLSSHTKLQTVLEFRDIFVANPDYFTMGKTPLSLENLLDYPILMLAPKSTTSEYLHQVFAAQGLKLLPEVELNSNDLLIDLAEIGLGIACIPDYMLRNRPGLEPVHLKTPLPARSAVIAHHEALQLSQAAQCFLKYFSQI